SNRFPKSAAAVLSAMPLEFFKALGDGNRLAIVAWLASQTQARTVSEVVAAGCCSVDFSVISRHLRALQQARGVGAERKGREVYYRLCCAPLVNVLRLLADKIEHCSAGSPPPTK